MSSAPQSDAQRPPNNPAVESSAQAREIYVKTKQELTEALAKKRELDKQLMQCEVNIYNFESAYLTETAGTGGGNIIQGFEAYLKNQNVNKRRAEITEGDRMFSFSSSTCNKSLELQAEDSDDQAETPGKYTAPGLQTVMLPPATRQQELQSAAQQKKDRDRLYQRNKRARKESRATASGDENDYSATGNNRKRRKANDDD